RLKSSRARCELSRRELARRSGISERYIAQIEAGKGNVSIVLLLRLASAIHGSQIQAACRIEVTAMGQLVLAAKVTHVPSLMLSERPD
ncbi:helix-turn-helix domain-containing protein, partial [Pseudomonas sp. FW305-33]|uniref:helix-turn-helix domain-containing protein n=1 Tax=Pseudomonas sp. FW305-33 TaxID=2751337 RepID=UPI001C487096